jgi:hypothetical protein
MKPTLIKKFSKQSEKSAKKSEFSSLDIIFTENEKYLCSDSKPPRYKGKRKLNKNRLSEKSLQVGPSNNFSKSCSIIPTAKQKSLILKPELNNGVFLDVFTNFQQTLTSTATISNPKLQKSRSQLFRYLNECRINWFFSKKNSSIFQSRNSTQKFESFSKAHDGQRERSFKNSSSVKKFNVMRLIYSGENI